MFGVKIKSQHQPTLFVVISTHIFVLKQFFFIVSLFLGNLHFFLHNSIRQVFCDPSVKSVLGAQ